MHVSGPSSSGSGVTLRKSDFPADFVWGVATAAYQVEGAVAEDGRGPSIWDTFSHTPGKVRNGDTGDVACDHYHRWEGDLDLMKDMGLNGYRFSVSWSRVLPQGRGPINACGLDFYDRLVDGLLARGISPYVTLYHWDLPQALQDRGGWTVRDTVTAFADYAGIVAQRLGDRVAGWITHNEPWVAAFLGHLSGQHAPGVADLTTALRVSHHLMLSHGLAARAIRAHTPRTPLGITLVLSPAEPASDSPEDRAATWRQDGHQNRWFLDPVFGRGYPQDMLDWWAPRAPQFKDCIQPGDLATIAAPLDFLGVNYYMRGVVKAAPNVPLLDLGWLRPEGEYTHFDWEVYPAGIRDVLFRVQRDYQPKAIYITENGSAFRDEVSPGGRVQDDQRRSYLERHLAACREAIQGGAKLKGFFTWSLIDNFEWAEGFDKRFGLVRVDFETQRRTVKASGEWYGKLARGEL